MQYYGYPTLAQDISSLARACQSYKPEVILGVARGGLMIAQMLAYALDVRRLLAIQAVSYDATMQRSECTLLDIPDLSPYHNVLIVDDIIDSGKTLETILETLKKAYPDATFKTAALFYKTTALRKPEY